MSQTGTSFRISIRDIIDNIKEIQEKSHDYGKLEVNTDSLKNRRKNASVVCQAVHKLVERHIINYPNSTLEEINLNISQQAQNALFNDEAQSEDDHSDDLNDDGFQISNTGHHYMSYFDALPPNYNREVIATDYNLDSTVVGISYDEPTYKLDAADSFGGSDANPSLSRSNQLLHNPVDDLSDDEQDEHAAPVYSWTISIRKKNPLLALTTDGIIQVLSELAPNLLTLRLCGWPLCQQSIARLLHPTTFPGLKRLSLAGSHFCNMFSTLGFPSGVVHPCLEEINFATCGGNWERGDDIVAPNVPVMISVLPALQRINFSESWMQIDDSLLKSIGSNCPDLRSFVASAQLEGDTEYGFNFTDEGLIDMIRECKRLEEFSIGRICGENLCHNILSLTPNLRVFVDGFGSNDCEDASRNNINLSFSDTGDAKVDTPITNEGFHEYSANISKLTQPPVSSLEVLILKYSLFTKPDIFPSFAMSKLCPSSSLRHLSIYLQDCDSQIDSFSQHLTEALNLVTSLERLEVIELPNHPLVDQCILRLLGEGKLSSLLSWTHSNEISYKISKSAWTVSIMEKIVIPCKLEQLSLRDVIISERFLKALSRMFPKLLWLKLDGYELSSLDNLSDVAAALSTLLLDFGCLQQLYLPTKSTELFDWFSFSLFRALTDNNEENARVLFPLSYTLSSIEILPFGPTTVPEWNQSLHQNVMKLMKTYSLTATKAVRLASKLPDRVSITTNYSYGNDAPYIELYRLRKQPSPKITPYDRMVRHIHFHDCDVSNYREATLHEAVANGAAIAALPPYFRYFDSIEEQKAVQVASKNDSEEIDVGLDSEDDSNLIPIHEYVVNASPLDSYRSMLRRLRRNSPRIRSLNLPRFLPKLAGEVSEDFNFQFNEQSVNTLLKASKNNRVITELTVFVQNNEQKLKLLLPEIVRGLSEYGCTWSKLTTVNFREGISAIDLVKIFNAWSTVLESPNQPCSLKQVQASVGELDETIVIASARLTVAASSTLTSLIVNWNNANAIQNTFEIYTAAAIQAVSDMLVRSCPNNNDPDTILSFNVGATLTDASNLMVLITENVRGKLCRPIKLSSRNTPPQLRAETKLQIDLNINMKLLDAFIDCEGNLILDDTVLCLGMEYVSIVRSRNIAKLFKSLRNRGPRYGITTSDDFKVFNRMLTKDGSLSRNQAIPIPPDFFLNSSVDQSIIAFDRMIEVLLPIYKSLMAAASPTFDDVKKAVGSLGPTDLFLYEHSFFTKKEVSSDLLIAQNLSPPSTAVDLAARIAKVDVAIDPPPIKFLSTINSAMCRDIMYVPGNITHWLNDADLWYGCGIRASDTTVYPVATIQAIRNTEASNLHKWVSDSKNLINPYSHNLVGALYAVEFNPVYSCQATQGSFLQSLFYEPTKVLQIHDDDLGLLSEFKMSLQQDQADIPPPAPLVDLKAIKIKVMTAYHYQENRNQSSKPGWTARVVIFNGNESSLYITRFDGSICGVLKEPVEVVSPDIEEKSATFIDADLEVLQSGKKEKGKRKRGQKADSKTASARPLSPPGTVLVINGICFVTWNKRILMYNLWDAENRFVAGLSSIDIYPIAVTPTHEWPAIAWSGDNYLFVSSDCSGSSKKKAHISSCLISTSNSVGSSASLTPSEETITLEKEMESPYITAILVTPQTVAACTFYSIQIFKRDFKGSNVCQFLRMIPCQSMSSGSNKLIPAGMFCGYDDDVLIYFKPPERQNFNQKRASSGGWIHIVSVTTNTPLLRIAGVMNHPCSLGLWSSNHATHNDKQFSAQNLQPLAGVDSFVVVGTTNMLFVMGFGPINCNSVAQVESSGIVDSSATDPTADFDITRVIEPTADVEFESLKKSIRKAIEVFSSKKGGRLAKIIEIIDTSTLLLRAEAITYAIYIACIHHLSELAIQLLQLCNGIKMPLPIWMLRCEVGQGLNDISKYAMEELTVLTMSIAAKQALKSFYSTALGAFIVLRPEVGKYVLEHFNIDQGVEISLVMLLAVIGYGYGIGGNFCHLNSPSLIRDGAPKDVVLSLLTLILNFCGNEKLLHLSPATLKMMQGRFENLQTRELAGRLKELIAKQGVMRSSIGNTKYNSIDESESRAAESNWLAYVAVVEKITTFALGHSGKFDVVKAESELAQIESLLPLSSNPEPPLLLTDAMLNVAIRTRIPNLLESNDSLPEHQIHDGIECSIYRDYPMTVLAASCLGERIEREGEADLESYLNLRTRLLVRVLECVGKREVNRMAFSKLTHCSILEPRLPIDLLYSPTLIQNLVGSSFVGCKLSSYGTDTDSYLPRYTLLPQILNAGNFSLKTKLSAIKLIQVNIKDIESRKEHARYWNQQQSYGSVDSTGNMERYYSFALKLLEESVATERLNI